ncbi:hypothetical protein ACLQ3C_11830 [Gordonia sp. DT30]|uniref:hypothetical protein n=1 Tax=Gordonia sp. DT30 TaxID=3416546 RepID=UPI003CF08A71
MTTHKPDPAQRPNVVAWAYRCWLVSGALLVILGIVYVVLGVVLSGPTLIPVGIGVVVAIVGGAYGFLGTNAYAGDIRWRSSLAALTLVAVIMLLVLSFLAPILAFALIAGIIGLFGSLLAYRPQGDAWFTGKDPATANESRPGKNSGRTAKANVKKADVKKGDTKQADANKRGRSRS